MGLIVNNPYFDLDFSKDNNLSHLGKELIIVSGNGEQKYSISTEAR